MRTDSNMRVYVMHPGKQHSFQLATAMKKVGMLGKYITSVYNKSGSITRLLIRFVKGDLRKKLCGRHCEDIYDNEVFQINELRVIITLFLNRFPRLQKFAEYWNLHTESLFYKKAMKLVKREYPNAIVIYNGYSNKHLEILDNTSIIKIMDMSIAKREYIQQILQKEIDETGLEDIKKAHFSYWDKKMLANDILGCKMVDFFLVPSKFVKDSLLKNGIEENQIKVVPYGVNISQFHPMTRSYEGRLKLIFVGSVTYRKGMHRLLHVVSEIPNVELYLAGTYDKNSPLYLSYKDNTQIHFEGFVTRDRLNELYNKCDVFVLPSLCEGMAMVGLEAMATGLPIICTYYTGVNDVVEDGVNGFVYDANNESALRQHILWFMNNKERLPRMSINARQTAVKYSWENYHTNVANAIKECINSRK